MQISPEILDLNSLPTFQKWAKTAHDARQVLKPITQLSIRNHQNTAWKARRDLVHSNPRHTILIITNSQSFITLILQIGLVWSQKRTLGTNLAQVLDNATAAFSKLLIVPFMSSGEATKFHSIVTQFSYTV